MKSILIVSYWFPPFQAMGTHRVASFVREFSHAGWRVGVVVPRDSKWTHDGVRGVPVPDCELCRTPAASWAVVLRRLSLGRLKGGAQTTGGQTVRGGRIKKFLYSFYNNRLCYPDECRPWIWLGSRQALIFARKFEPDLLLSSAMPASAHVIAARIQRELDVPWIADYRDLWTRHRTRPRPFRHDQRFQQLEDKTIRNASILTTVSREYARVLETNTGKPCEVVYNGFDPEDLPAWPPQRTGQPFTVLYTGMIYPDEQHPEIFMRGMKRFLDSEKPSPQQVRFLYMGASNITLSRLATTVHIETICEIRKSQLREKALQNLLETDLLLFLPCETPGWIPGKLFEYLSSGKPILSVGAESEEVRELVDLCPSAVRCPDTQAVHRALKAHWESWRAHGPISASCSVRIRDFTRQEQGQKMVQLAEQLRGNKSDKLPAPKTTSVHPI